MTPLKQILSNNFPQTGLRFAFGYGSKVVSQGSATKSSDLLDMIIAVDDPVQWHKENLMTNKSHYSALKYLPNAHRTIANFQENYGAKIYFNPYVNIDNLSIKYGIIKTDHLLDDLYNWTNLYVAGRLQKPVEFLIDCDKDESIKAAIRLNRENALRTALLLLPETFDSFALYKTITKLSYEGDVRMMFGEDKNKVDNIVINQIDRFNQLYLPMLKLNNFFKTSVVWDESRKVFSQDLSPRTILKHLNNIPRNLKSHLCLIHKKKAQTIATDAILQSIARSIFLDEIVAKAIRSIVSQSSFSQSAKGLLTAGAIKSLRYSKSKLTKSLLSRVNLSK